MMKATATRMALLKIRTKVMHCQRKAVLSNRPNLLYDTLFVKIRNDYHEQGIRYKV